MFLLRLRNRYFMKNMYIAVIFDLSLLIPKRVIIIRRGMVINIVDILGRIACTQCISLKCGRLLHVCYVARSVCGLCVCVCYTYLLCING